MVHFMGDDIEDYLPNTHLGQPRETQWAIQVLLPQPFETGERPLVNPLHRPQQRPLRCEVLGQARPALASISESGKVIGLCHQCVTDQLSQRAHPRFRPEIECGIGQTTDSPFEGGMQGLPQGDDFLELVGRLPALLHGFRG